MYIQVCFGKEEVSKCKDLLNTAVEKYGDKVFDSLNNHHEVVSKGNYLIDSNMDDDGVLTLNVGVDVSYMEFIIKTLKDITVVVKPIVGALKAILEPVKSKFQDIKLNTVHKINGTVVSKEEE